LTRESSSPLKGRGYGVVLAWETADDHLHVWDCICRDSRDVLVRMTLRPERPNVDIGSVLGLRSRFPLVAPNDLEGLEAQLAVRGLQPDTEATNASEELSHTYRPHRAILPLACPVRLRQET